MITRQQIISWLEHSSAIFSEKKAYLTELDAPIGDSDHGINMARGFDRLLETLPTIAETDIGNILRTSGTTLISSVGGASGPLYGTFFMRAGAAVNAQQELDGAALISMLEAGIKGVQDRGRASLGDKTMLDAWLPALDALKAAIDSGKSIGEALNECAAAAEQGVQNTTPMVAKRGRASYLGERSIGHPDPGATSAYYLLQALADVVSG